MLTIKVIFLAILQGITEFLPISSSGHLAVCQNILGIEDESSVLLAVILHAGTLLSIIIFYFKVLISLLEKKNHRVILLIIIGTIPAAILWNFNKKGRISGQDFYKYAYSRNRTAHYCITIEMGNDKKRRYQRN